MPKHTAQEQEKPLWLKTPLEEIEEIAVKLAKEGNTPERIGLILRDQHGIPTTRVFGKKLGQILKEKGVEINADIVNVQKKFEKIKSHLQKHHKDKKSKRAFEIRTARLRKVKAYAARKKESF